MPLLLIALAVASSLWFSRGPSQPVAAGAPPPPVIDEAAGPGSQIVVHVSGAVAAPGLIAVPADARVADVVAAAGGAGADARLDRLNLAAGLRDGEHIVVPSMSDRPAGSSVRSDDRVHVNTASPTDLERLPGVGPVLASRIAAYRDANGPFTSIEDLLGVPGIGEGKLATLRGAAAVP